MTTHFPEYGTGTSIHNGEVKLILRDYNSSLCEMPQTCNCFPHVNKMTTLIYNWANIVNIKNAIPLNIIHNIFNLRQSINIIQSFKVVISLSFHYKRLLQTEHIEKTMKTDQ
jgi:hypothetical protein